MICQSLLYSYVVDIFQLTKMKIVGHLYSNRYKMIPVVSRAARHLLPCSQKVQNRADSFRGAQQQLQAPKSLICFLQVQVKLFPAINEATSGLYIAHRILLNHLVVGLQFEDLDELWVVGCSMDAVDDGISEFSLGQILTESLGLGHSSALKVHIIIANLEDDSQEIDEARKVPVASISVFWLNERGT